VFLAALATLLAGIVILGVGDAAISIADTSIPDNEVSGTDLTLNNNLV